MLRVGSLVKSKHKTLYLTPDPTPQNVEDLESWPEWNDNEIGVVISMNKIGIKILISSGIGYCFFDEIKSIS